MRPTKELGNKGELLVSQYLEQRGFSVLARNFTCKLGEIDVIAQKDDILAFVEVKTRKTLYFPTSSVITLGKQRKIVKTAKYYIIKNNVIDKACRFDVATVFYDESESKIDYIECAFYGA